MQGKIENIRVEFPILERQVYGKKLVYLDNAATAQRPRSVIDKWNEISSYSNANIHRAVHRLADEATNAYEQGRDAVVRYINAASREEVILTSGATESINLVAYSFGDAFVNAGDEVIVTEAEHHSNIVPWQLMCLRRGAVLKVLPVSDDGYLQTEKLDTLITGKTRIIALTHISNVLGIINPVKEIIEKCHALNVPVLVDGSQGIVHTRVDVRDLDCDFYVFSGHKIYAATGTGVLYGKKKYLDSMPPFQSGGEMVGRVTFKETTYASLPLKFEAGTRNFASAASLVPALELAEKLFSDPEIAENERKITEYMLDELGRIDGLKLYGVPHGTSDKIPLFSFSIDGVHHEDLALIMDKMGIAVRSGQMCAEPLMDRMGVSGMLRVSFLPYNTLQEAEYFIASLKKAIMMLK